MKQKETSAVKFTKMHGAGNDYIYLDCLGGTVDDPAALAVRMSDRHFGIGSDGLVLILPSDDCDFRMRMFNADGSEAQMCGNASRCVGKYVYDKGLAAKTALTLETAAGVKTLRLHTSGGKVNSVTVAMGTPVLEPARIPVRKTGEAVIDEPLFVGKELFRMTCVSMGNPHAVLFVRDLESVNVPEIGPQMEHLPLFPERCNVEFAEVTAPDRIRMRVWERGTGETLACGTGACAVLVAAVLNGFTKRKATLQLPGGALEVEWDRETGNVSMTGGAETVFEGEWPG